MLIHAVGEVAKTIAVLRARGIATSQPELHAAAEALQGHLGQIVRAEDSSEVRSVMTPPAGFDVRPTQSQFPPATFLHSETNDEMPLTRTDLAHQEPSRAQSARTVTSTASVNVMQPPLPPLQSATPPTAGGRLTCSVCKIFFKGSQVYRRFLEDHPDRRIECSASESQRKEAWAKEAESRKTAELGKREAMAKACAKEAGLRKMIELEQREALAKERAEKNEAERAAALHRTAAAQEASRVAVARAATVRSDAQAAAAAGAAAQRAARNDAKAEQVKAEERDLQAAIGQVQAAAPICAAPSSGLSVGRPVAAEGSDLRGAVAMGPPKPNPPDASHEPAASRRPTARKETRRAKKVRSPPPSIQDHPGGGLPNGAADSPPVAAGAIASDETRLQPPPTAGVGGVTAAKEGIGWCGGRRV